MRWSFSEMASAPAARSSLSTRSRSSSWMMYKLGFSLAFLEIVLSSSTISMPAPSTSVVPASKRSRSKPWSATLSAPFLRSSLISCSRILFSLSIAFKRSDKSSTLSIRMDLCCTVTLYCTESIKPNTMNTMAIKTLPCKSIVKICFILPPSFFLLFRYQLNVWFSKG